MFPSAPPSGPIETNRRDEIATVNKPWLQMSEIDGKRKWRRRKRRKRMRKGPASYPSIRPSVRPPVRPSGRSKTSFKSVPVSDYLVFK